MKKNKIAIVQMKSSINKTENLSTSIEYIKSAARNNAKLICFPEFQMAYSPSDQTPRELFDISERIAGNFISSLSRYAKIHQINIIATMYERTNNKDEKDYHVLDTAVFINNNGLIKSVYRKLHLYDALGFKESNKLKSGNAIIKPVKTSLGNFGLMICYDLRFPEMSRILTLKGANVLVIPSAWIQGIMKEEHWQIMNRARAIENGLYIISPNQVGNIFSGRSLVVDPFGAILTDMGNREGVEIIELNQSLVTQIRKSLPLLFNRRIDVYKANIKDLISIF